MDKDFFICTVDKNGSYLVYESEMYRFSEFELLNLIRICLIEQRSKAIGNKLLKAYKDSTLHRESMTKERLKKIGIDYDEKDKRPVVRRKAKRK